MNHSEQAQVEGGAIFNGDFMMRYITCSQKESSAKIDGSVTGKAGDAELAQTFHKAHWEKLVVRKR